MSTPSKVNDAAGEATARRIDETCVATTESTSTWIRLNSSKHDHDPVCARPEKSLAIAVWLSDSEQFHTMHCLARALARSLVVSVLPVPAGPCGAPPRTICIAPTSVR